MWDLNAWSALLVRNSVIAPLPLLAQRGQHIGDRLVGGEHHIPQRHVERALQLERERDRVHRIPATDVTEAQVWSKVCRRLAEDRNERLIQPPPHILTQTRISVAPHERPPPNATSTTRSP